MKPETQNPKAGWWVDVALAAAALPACVWLGVLALRSGSPVEQPSPVPMRPVQDEFVARLAALTEELDRRLDAVEKKIAMRPRAEPAREVDDALLERVRAERAKRGPLAGLGDWAAPAAAEETLDDLACEVGLKPEQRPAVIEALRAYFAAYYARMSDTLGGVPPASDPGWRDLAEALERDLRALLTPEQFAAFLKYRDRRPGK